MPGDLCFAAYRGNLGRVQELIRGGASLEERDDVSPSVVFGVH